MKIDGSAAPTRASSVFVAITLIFLVGGCASRELPFRAEGTQGQVGHPIHAAIILDDKAAGCGGHAAGEGFVAARTLPPGVWQNGLNDLVFARTPTKTGHWASPRKFSD